MHCLLHKWPAMAGAAGEPIGAAPRLHISVSAYRRISPVVIWSEANVVAPGSYLLQVCALDGAVVTDLNLILLASPVAGAHKTLITGKALMWNMCMQIQFAACLW